MSELLMKCEVCNSLLDEEDLFCANCGTEAPRDNGSAETATGRTRQSTHNFECSGCGASMSFNATAGSLQCPFCASVDMVQQKDAKILSPQRIVPFELQRDAAVAKMRKWLGRGFFRPGDLATRAGIVRMQPVYVPYWVFQAKTHTYWTADSSHTPARARGDWYPMSGEHRGDHPNLLVGASGALSPSETSCICPFDLGQGVAPDQVELDDVTVEQFSVPRKYARPLARGIVQEIEEKTCAGQYVPGRARNVHANVRIESMSSEPLLLPVWIMAYRYKDRVFRFLVNGQSGKATGQAPVSWLKILAVGGIVLAAILAVLLIAGVASGATETVSHQETFGNSIRINTPSKPTGGDPWDRPTPCSGSRPTPGSGSHGSPPVGLEGDTHGTYTVAPPSDIRSLLIY